MSKRKKFTGPLLLVPKKLRGREQPLFGEVPTNEPVVRIRQRRRGNVVALASHPKFGRARRRVVEGRSADVLAFRRTDSPARV